MIFLGMTIGGIQMSVDGPYQYMYVMNVILFVDHNRCRLCIVCFAINPAEIKPQDLPRSLPKDFARTVPITSLSNFCSILSTLPHLWILLPVIITTSIQQRRHLFTLGWASFI